MADQNNQITRMLSDVKIQRPADGKMEHHARAPFVGGNWKSQGFRSTIGVLVNDLNSGKSTSQRLEIAVAPGHLHLGYVSRNLKRSFDVSAQDCSEFDVGAYTGDLSATQLRDFGINWVILGHSERRRYHNDTDFIISTKIKLAVKAGLRVIGCFGETLEERKAGLAVSVIKRQVKSICDAIGPDELFSVVLAYEPVWAIGTGLSATPQQAQEMHYAIRSFVAENYGFKSALKVRIIYGGSVKPNNAAELYAQPDIDGFLVGGASLKASSFLSICSSVSDHYEANKRKIVSRL